MVRNLTKIQLIGVLLMLAIILPITEIYASSSIYPSVFSRFKGGVLAQYIIDTGRIPFSQSSFSGTSILSQVTEVAHNPLSSLLVAIISKTIDKPAAFIQFLPIYTLIFVLSQSLVVARLLKKPIVFPVAVVFSISFQYLMPMYISGMHRGYLAWTLFFVLLLYILISNKYKQKYLSTGFLVIVVAFIISAHTLPIATLGFFICIYLSHKLINRFIPSYSYHNPDVINSNKILIIISVVFTYYAIVFSWIGDSVVGLSVMTSLIIEEGILSATLSGSVGVSPILPVTDISQPNLFKWMFTLANLTAFILAVSSALLRTKWILWTKKIELVDIFLIAIIFQGIIDAGLQFIFPSSGGINPLFLGLFFTPLFGAIVFSRVWRSIDISSSSRSPTTEFIRPVSILIVLFLLLTPAMVVQMWQPNTPSAEITTLPEENYQQARWTIQHSDGVVISSFNMLSAYLYMGGREVFLPPPGSPAYSSEHTAERFVRLYYTDPPTANRYADVYLVTDQMENVGIFNIGSIITKPSGQLSQSLGSSSDWSKVYSSGAGKSFVSK